MDNLTMQCCVCNRIRIEDRWYSEDLGRAINSGAKYSHGYCRDCYENVIAEISSQGFKESIEHKLQTA